MFCKCCVNRHFFAHDTTSWFSTVGTTSPPPRHPARSAQPLTFATCSAHHWLAPCQASWNPHKKIPIKVQHLIFSSNIIQYYPIDCWNCVSSCINLYIYTHIMYIYNTYYLCIYIIYYIIYYTILYVYYIYIYLHICIDIS